MKLTPVLLICVALAGCGGDDEKATAPKKEAATPASANAEADVREMFDSYMAALKDRDFEEACGKLAPETTAKLQENVKRLGITDAPEECDEILATIYGAADKQPGGKKLLEELH